MVFLNFKLQPQVNIYPQPLQPVASIHRNTVISEL